MNKIKALVIVALIWLMLFFVAWLITDHFAWFIGLVAVTGTIFLYTQIHDALEDTDMFMN